MAHWLLLTISLFGIGAKPQVLHHVTHTQNWAVEVDKDTFTGQVRCVARRPHLLVRDSVIFFDLGPKTNTEDAFFRLDGGRARAARDLEDDDHALGARFDDGPIENPSGGKVAMPVSTVLSVQRVEIRASAERQPVSFDLRGLGAAIDAERAAGCTA